MVQQPRYEQPLYCCRVSVEAITGQTEAEMMAFAPSANEAKQEAERLLIEHYHCTSAQVQQVMQTAQVESLSPWCKPRDA